MFIQIKVAAHRWLGFEPARSCTLPRAKRDAGFLVVRLKNSKAEGIAKGFESLRLFKMAHCSSMVIEGTRSVAKDRTGGFGGGLRP